MSPRRPDFARARVRRTSLPAVAASLALTAGLVGCIAPTAPAEGRAPAVRSDVATSSAAVEERPALNVVTTGAFEVRPGRSVTVGTPVVFTYRFTNTGNVPLDDVGPGHEHLEVGWSYEFVSRGRTVDAVDLEHGYVTSSRAWAPRTPTGWYVSPTFTFHLPIPSSGR